LSVAEERTRRGGDRERARRVSSQSTLLDQVKSFLRQSLRLVMVVSTGSQ